MASRPDMASRKYPKSRVTEHVWGPPEEDLDEPEEALCEVDQTIEPNAKTLYHYRFRSTRSGHYVCSICGKKGPVTP